ncbi:FAD-dependent oxidoreductase [Streptomyces microflavus]|uniref:FAD-dependent oxidoreductase n=1 Tax=Streptomyces sp. 058-1L TaxID=2789266 RepID=UPI00397F62C2
MTAGERVVVVGAGVAGLTSAVVLAEAGVSVHVIAEQVPGVTSLAAGAMWGPYLVEPKDKVDRWGQRSLEIFRELAQDKATGVRLTSGIEASRTAEAPPDWATTLPGFRPCESTELPDGFTAGYRFTVPLIDMPTYLDYLLCRLRAGGGTVEQRRLTSLADVGPTPLIVNCAGLGARDLAVDSDLRPIRGQHVVVANPGLIEFFSEDTGTSPDLLCFYPHGETVVLGGTAIDEEGDLAPDDTAAARILARCAEVEPRLALARVLEHRIGARPARSVVRVEAERQDEVLVVHNYGHGGAGVTLSWGCAEATRELLSIS